MDSRSRHRFDVLVVGGGPAGMAAAATAAECGVRVGIVDDNPELGGQIWRSDGHEARSEPAAWRQRVQTSGAIRVNATRVVDQPQAGVLIAERADEIVELRYGKLIVATGARERFLPFPGWTLPNVMGAGGLQAMVKCGLPVDGKRVIVAGTGPLLLAVASYLRKRGAEIILVCEQASWSRLALFAATLAGFPEKVRQALELRKQLGGISFAADSWVVSAHGEDRLESVTVSRGGKLETLECDYLACGFHLVPNVELAGLLGCRLSGGFVYVDELQQTSVKDTFCAGEPTGIGGVESALVEGQIAGFAAEEQAERARRLFGERKKARRFAALLDKTFRLRSELKNVVAAETIICRCEDVVHLRLRSCQSWREAKLQTRCGMGPCQGRICGPAAEFLHGWEPDSVRPPIFPAQVASLAAGVTNETSPETVTISGGTA